MTKVHFSITGEFVTNHARNLWAESEYEKAFRILECVEGLSKDHINDIIQGKQQLTGVNDLLLKEDDWKPDEYLHYPTFHEILRQGKSEEELRGYKEREADEYIKRHVYLVHELEFPTGESTEEALICEQKAKQLIGEEEYEYNLAEHVENFEAKKRAAKKPKAVFKAVETKPPMGDWLREQEEAGQLDLSDPLTMQNVMALDPMFFIDKRMAMDKKTAQGVIPQKETELFEKGWLLPNGDYYRCHYMEHAWLAGELLEKKFPDELNYEKKAEDLGWVKLTGVGTWPIHLFKKLTKKQCNRLWDYCEKFKFDYKFLVEEPNDRY